MTHPPIRVRSVVFAALTSVLTVWGGLIGLIAATSCRRAAVAAPAPTPAAAGAPAPGLAATPALPAKADAAGYDFRAEEKTAVERYLRENANLRVATDADQRPSGDGDVSNLYGVYHPYFVRGDANDDGRLDFVLAFVRRDSDRDTPWFSVVVFEGRPDGTFAPGALLERDISLADGDLSLDRDSIVVTPDTSEDASRRYRWDPARQRHVFVRDEDDAPEVPSSSQT
jgi:hypothetical protein